MARRITPSAATPNDFERNEVVFEYYDDGPDERGQRHFAMYWWSDERVRGQQYHADPEPHKKRWNADGYVVLERRVGGASR